jgi:hypothetical protein
LLFELFSRVNNDLFPDLPSGIWIIHSFKLQYLQGQAHLNSTGHPELSYYLNQPSAVYNLDASLGILGF